MATTTGKHAFDEAIALALEGMSASEARECLASLERFLLDLGNHPVDYPGELMRAFTLSPEVREKAKADLRALALNHDRKA